MKRVHVKPAEGRAVPDPARGGELLSVEGYEVPLTAFWQRRINDADVIVGMAASLPKAKGSAAK
ncbi:DUF2635 domain-containing protein [Pseudomonas viridiflava]|uniref:DUF2635 domain-containing protein n=1 Tax=Pseudomonas viridiflava TaxID=33069 RepID=UPI000F05454C|nr:DUF2635 domain-containing protein [Pseudomonas viridiflava]